MRYFILSTVFFLNLSSACKSINSDESGSAKQYLALGDSYTIGESVSSSETYPQQLVNALNKKEVNYGSPTFIAKTGWTTSDLKRGIKNAEITGKKYNLVSLLIGVNNEFQGKNLTEFEKEFTELLDQAIGFAKNKESVFVLSIPDYGFTPFGKDRQSEISARIDQFNAIVKKVSQTKNVHFYDITPISRNGLEDPELVAKDGLHPSGKMYSEFVQLILKDFLK